LLRFLKLRVVVNGAYIYALVRNKPIVIDIPTNPSKVVVTDGFHITQPLELNYPHLNSHAFNIACAIEDEQLIGGFFIILVLYGIGALSDNIVIQLMALIPIVYFLFLYYINRKEFIRIRPA
jgi:hypothetical protein